MSGTFQGSATLQFTPDNKHAYYFTGMKTGGATVSIKSLGTFSTNSEFIVGKIQAVGPTELTSNNGGRESFYLYYNGELVLTLLNDFDTGNMMQSSIANIIIPPFTDVEIKFSDNSGATYVSGAIITGTVHGAIEQFNLEVKE